MATGLTDVWGNVLTMWSASNLDLSGGNPQNISLEEVANVVGSQASIPDIDSALVGQNYKLSGSFGGLIPNVGTIKRCIQNDQSVGSLSNTIFITRAGTYKVTNFVNGGNGVYKNGSLVDTLTGVGDTTSLVGMVVGDQVFAEYPFTCHHTNYPGQQGAWGGYAGYCFATRRDRVTPVIHLQNLSQVTANVEIMFSATGNSNITSMTSVHTAELSPFDEGGGGSQYDGSFSTSTSGNYYILSDQLICCWRGQGPTSDTSAMYPLSSEHVYGFFSQDGHTFSVNNAQVERTNTGGGGSIRGRASDTSGAVICSPNSGRGNAYTATTANSTIRGGSYFSGNCCVVYDADALGTTSRGLTLFGAESQADGNGNNQTYFVGQLAMQRVVGVGGACAWNAFVVSNYSGSTPSNPGYGDVVMRFNSSKVFQEAKSFVGNGQNASAPFSAKAYFGNGSGTGTSANAGDFFVCNRPMMAWMDSDTTDKDETNCFMFESSDTLTNIGITANSFTIQCSSFSAGSPGTIEGWEDASTACENLNSGTFTQGTLYSPSSTLSNGSVLFWDVFFQYPVNGGNYFFGVGAGRSYSQFQLGYEGIIKTTPTSC